VGSESVKTANCQSTTNYEVISVIDNTISIRNDDSHQGRSIAERAAPALEFLLKYITELPDPQPDKDAMMVRVTEMPPQQQIDTANEILAARHARARRLQEERKQELVVKF